MSTSVSKRSKGKQTSDNRIAVLLGAVAVALGAWAWRSYRTRNGPGADKAPGASPFKFPKSAKASAQTSGNNKKNKARKREERERRAEKREQRPAAAATAKGPDGSAQPAGAPGSGTSVMNYTYFDSARRDTVLSAAPRRAALTAADVAALDEKRG